MRLNLRQKEIQADRLASDLQGFSQYVAAILGGACSTIAANTDDREVQELTLRLKMEVIPTLRLVAVDQDLRRGFLQCWLLAVDLRRALTEGPIGKTLFKEQQGTAVEAARRIEDAIVLIGTRHFGADLIEEAKPKAEALTRQISVRGRLLTNAPHVDVTSTAQGASLWNEFTSIPLSPFRSLSGVGDTPGAINNFTIAARGIAVIVNELPERIRWESELLLLRIDSLESLVQTRSSLKSFAASAESISKTAQTLPADLRKELDAALSSTDAAQENLRKTLGEVRKAVEDVGGVASTADRVSSTIRDATAKMAEAGQTWEAAAKAIDGMLNTYKDLASRSDEKAKDRPPEKDPTTVRDYVQLGTELRGAAVEIRGLLDDLNSGKLAKALQEVQGKSALAIDHAAEEARSIVDRLTLRIAIIVGAAVLVVVGLKVIAARLVSRRSARSAGAE
jgi:hypothetical protein